jgi:alpha-L-fucosidase
MIAKRMFLRIFGLNSTLLVLFATLLHIGLHAQTNVTSNPYGTSGDFYVNETPAQFESRMKWWTDSRFGLFIHWNMSSLTGTEISWSRKATRPLDVDKTPAGYVGDPVYDNLYKQFNPIRFDATEWVRLAKEAGMKYIVFTAKHHDGFCMWDTKLTSYSIMNTPFKRDVVKELADACHKAGMPIGIYYSQRDWHHPDYGAGDNSKYTAYLKGQLTELLTNYGQIDCIWFDGFGAGGSIKFWRAPEVLNLVRSLQPKIIINNRARNCWFEGDDTQQYEGPSIMGDHDTPEGTIGSFQNDRPWESCMMTIKIPGALGWSYRSDAIGVIKSEECVRMLASCATGDGNLLLDVGPNALGVIPADQADLLKDIGEWMRKNGESIYNTNGGPFRNGEWGGSTYRGSTIFLHVFKWNNDRLKLPPLKAKIVKCSVKFEQTAKGITLIVPGDKQDKTDTVVILELSAPAVNEMENGKPLMVEKLNN